MSNFNSAVLTKKGNELLVTAAAGKQIIFTRLVTGCGIYTEDEKQRAALEQAAGLKEQRQQFTFSKYEKVSETSVLLTALITNKELTEGYKITEIGVYGKEVGSEEDFLCSIAVTRSLEETDSFPPYNGLRECQIIQDYYITISPDLEVTVNTQGAAALAEDLEELKRNFTKIVWGPENTEIKENETLFVLENETEETGDFTGASFSNMTFSEVQPDEGQFWAEFNQDGIVDGKLAVSEEDVSNAVFFGKLDSE